MLPTEHRGPGLAALLLAAAGAAAAACAQAQPLDARIASCLDRARPALRHHLAQSHGGVLALCCLAALHDGMAADDPVFADALDRLRRAELDSCYGPALRLMVLAEHPDLPDRDALAARDTAALLARQTTGGFSYHPNDGWWDLSNTQYAALGLRAASALGVEVPRRAWTLLYQAVRRMQHEAGGFPYRPGQGSSNVSVSMTVAGIAVLEICAQALELSPADRERLDVFVGRAWGWLAARREQIGWRRTERCYYFHYGLERAAILGDVTEVGGKDWYAAGARMLCDEQQRGGGFAGSRELRADVEDVGRGHPVDTAFAVLFLRRGFHKELAPVTGPRAPRVAALTAEAGDDQVRAAARHDAARGRSALPALLDALRSDITARRKAAVLAIHRITGRTFGLHPYRTAAQQGEAIAAVERWLRLRGAAGSDRDER